MTNPISSTAYDDLLGVLSSTSIDKRKKFEALSNNRGLLTWQQGLLVLHQFKDSADKLKAIRILEQRFERMTCAEAAELLRVFTLSSRDRLIALESLKRHLIDHQSTVGVEYLLSAFDNEKDKIQAMAIAQTVCNFVADRLAAGGHQGYGATGGLHAQSWPLDQHIYGPIEDQMKRLPGRGEPQLPVHAQPGRINSVYDSQASFAYPTDRNAYQSRPYMASVPAPDEC